MQQAWRWVTLFLLLLAAAPAAADPRLPAIFSDHMVLQQQMPIGVWGWAAPDERIEVSLRAQRVSTTAGRDGRWRVTLAPEAAGGPDELKVAGATVTKRFVDVLIGEVWVGSGQSNMQWEVRAGAGRRHGDRGRRAPAHPALLGEARHRARAEGRRHADGRRPDVERSRPPAVTNFSAVGYFFSRELQTGARNVPVGFIHSSWGGTPAEAWTRRDVLARGSGAAAAAGAVPPHRRRSMRRSATATSGVSRSGTTRSRPGRRRTRTATPIPGMPAPRGGARDPHRPASLWNAMIAPITPFAIRGVLWYQGETNALRAWDYQRLMTAMIQDWRRRLESRRPAVPVRAARQLRPEPADPGATWWAEVREAQRLTLGLPNTGMASAIDIGNPLTSIR